MKKYIIMIAVSAFLATQAMAGGNDPQVSVRNYKHPNKAAKAKAEKSEKLVVLDSKTTTEQLNYKATNSGKKQVIKPVFKTSTHPQRNYKNQFVK